MDIKLLRELSDFKDMLTEEAIMLVELDGLPPDIQAKWEKMDPRTKNRILKNLIIGIAKQGVEDNERMIQSSDRVLNPKHKQQGTRPEARATK